MTKYIEYANAISANNEVLLWIKTALSAHLKNNQENQVEIEHMIDYACSEDGPKKMIRMSYEQLKAKTDAWTNALIKKGKNIVEGPGDIETVLEFDDKSKIVKLIGDNAFKREGFLMSHCSGNYSKNSDSTIYSLRDKDNNPHATMEATGDGEQIKQIKGKGNGSIHPNYIKKIVSFLKFLKVDVRKSEMKNLGYYQFDSEMLSLVEELNGRQLPKTHILDGEYYFVG